MAGYIELTEKLILAMRAGARAIANTKRYHGTIFVSDAFSENPKEIPYLQAAEILRAASENDPADVAPVRHGRWEGYSHSRYCGVDDFGDPIYKDGVVYYCSGCRRKTVIKERYCPNCGAIMDLED